MISIENDKPKKKTTKNENTNKDEKNKTQIRLKLLRVENGLTQEQIAERLNISQQRYSLVEKSGKVDVNILKKICEEFKISSDYLLGLDDHQERATVVKRKVERNFIRVYNDQEED